MIAIIASPETLVVRGYVSESDLWRIKPGAHGRFVPEAEAKISIFDSALITGDMAFESTRTFRGVPFELKTHLKRLSQTLEILQLIGCCQLVKSFLSSLFDFIPFGIHFLAFGINTKLEKNISSYLLV